MKKNYVISALLLLLATHLNAQDGIFVEFRLTSDMMNGTLKTFLLDGNSRTEMNLETQMAPKNMNMTTLVLKSTPGVVYTINEPSKSYTEANAPASGTENDEYEITVIGKEAVNSYNCTHVKVTNTKSQKTMDMWLSKDVSNYATYAAVKNKYFGGGTFFNKLKEKGAEGYVVRMITSDIHAGQIQLDLITAGTKPMDAAKFSLDGYTKSASANPMMPSSPNVDVKQLQNMTPEERKKYIDDMKAKYQQQH